MSILTNLPYHLVSLGGIGIAAVEGAPETLVSNWDKAGIVAVLGSLLLYGLRLIAKKDEELRTLNAERSADARKASEDFSKVVAEAVKAMAEVRDELRQCAACRARYDVSRKD